VGRSHDRIEVGFGQGRPPSTSCIGGEAAVARLVERSGRDAEIAGVGSNGLAPRASPDRGRLAPAIRGSRGVGCRTSESETCRAVGPPPLSDGSWTPSGEMIATGMNWATTPPVNASEAIDLPRRHFDSDAEA